MKWLEDPAVLNKVLNWYFSIFGALSLARLLIDSMGTATSFVFPDLPPSGRRSRFPLPKIIRDLLRILRELPFRKLEVRAYVRDVISAHFKIGPQGITGLLLALAAQLYYNLSAKPWWLTNLLGFSVSYSTLQLMSPTTS